MNARGERKESRAMLDPIAVAPVSVRGARL